MLLNIMNLLLTWMGWLRDYLWMNSSQLINGYNPFSMNSLTVWTWTFLFGQHQCATTFMFYAKLEYHINIDDQILYTINNVIWYDAFLNLLLYTDFQKILALFFKLYRQTRCKTSSCVYFRFVSLNTNAKHLHVLWLSQNLTD